MPKRYTLEEFKDKCNKKHDYKYDYSLVEYKSNKQDVIIICSCGNIFKKRAEHHLKGYGCTVCKPNNFSKNNKNSFIEDCNKKHNNFYSYDKVIYTDSSKKVIITCPEHGDFEQIANDHKQGHGCSKCMNIYLESINRKTNGQYIKDATLKHKGLYDYSQVKYTTIKDKITIICKEHGIFRQQAGPHLSGQGCPKCALFYNSCKKEHWIKQAKDRQGVFYIIRCYNETEEFYKLGITSWSVKKRYRCNDKRRLPYNYEIVKEVKSYDLDYIWELEKRFKRIKIKQHYTPLIPFKGSVTECFK